MNRMQKRILRNTLLAIVAAVVFGVCGQGCKPTTTYTYHVEWGSYSTDTPGLTLEHCEALIENHGSGHPVWCDTTTDQPMTRYYADDAD